MHPACAYARVSTRTSLRIQANCLWGRYCSADAAQTPCGLHRLAEHAFCRGENKEHGAGWDSTKPKQHPLMSTTEAPRGTHRTCLLGLAVLVACPSSAPISIHPARPQFSFFFARPQSSPVKPFFFHFFLRSSPFFFFFSPVKPRAQSIHP